ncbi:hypothetical protein [Candidatus Reidiella endopervernicosa]|nr:hypothetical protein [Candidatus Reidiella endopervernicosa]QKQ25552.1 hypothetical protein HUE57_03985 [Candidatus Reidiella endopervernicosa]
MTSAFQVHAEREGKKRVLTPCDICPSLPGYVDASQISDDIRKMVGKYRGGSGKKNVAIQKTRRR